MPRRSDFLTSIASCSYPSIAFEYFYEENAPGTAYDNLGFFVNEILISLAASGADVLNLQEGQLIGIASGDPNYSQAITNLLNSEFDNSDITRPHAYLVWMMGACPERSRRDNNMNLDPASSGAVKVQNPNALESVLRNDIPVAKDGYCHVYLSNGSAAYVNFDNFNVARVQGKVRQINDYGSPCACAPAIADGMAIYGLNGDHDDYLNKYTGKEYQTGEFDPSLSQGLEMFDFGSRFYDAQLGRWHAPDPAEQFYNPYLAMVNNPVSYVDPDGEFVFLATAIGAVVGGYIGGAIQQGEGGLSGGNYNPFGGKRGSWDNTSWKGITVGFVAGAGIGFGVGSIASAAGANVAGITIAKGGTLALDKTTTLGFDVAANALITGNINMLSSWARGGDWGSVATSGLVGLGAGAIGGFVGSQINDAIHRTMSNEGVKATNLITGGLNGFGDRYFASTENRLQNGFIGMVEGLYLANYWGNKSKVLGLGLGGRFPAAGRFASNFITQATTSVPGLGMTVATYHAQFASGRMLYNLAANSGSTQLLSIMALDRLGLGQWIGGNLAFGSYEMLFHGLGAAGLYGTLVNRWTESYPAVIRPWGWNR